MRLSVSYQSAFKFLIIALVLLRLFDWVNNHEEVFSIPSLIKYVFSVAVLMILFVYGGFYTLSRFSKGKISFLHWLFIGWSIYLILSTIRMEMFYFQEFFAAQFFVTPYIIPPLILYFRTNIILIKKLFKITLKLLPFSLLFIVYSFVNLNFPDWLRQLSTIELFNIAIPILFLSSTLFKKKRIVFFSFLYLIGLLILMMLYGRRTLFLEINLFFFFFVLIWVLSRGISSKKKLVFSILIFFVFAFASHLILERKNEILIFERGIDYKSVEAGRETIVQNFFLDFRSTKDWIFGRGLDGRILREIRGEEYGRGIENGFLHILLKGGLLYLIPYLLILFKASYYGFFKSKNDLTKAFAAFIITYVVVMIAFNIPAFSAKYLLLWLSVPICMSAEIRGYSNFQIKQQLNL